MLMPAAPAPTMHRSASSTLPFGRVRASMCMAGCRGGSVREKGEESALARLGYRDHPSLQHHRPSDREVLLDQPGDRWGPRSPCENGSVQRVHVILARHERAVPQSDLTHRLRSDQGKEIRLRQRQQVDCGVGAGPTRASGQACQRTGGTHTEEPATVHAHVRNTSVLTYRRSEEHTSELQSHHDLVCRLLLEKKKKNTPSSINMLCTIT